MNISPKPFEKMLQHAPLFLDPSVFPKTQLQLSYQIQEI